jgi:hypothetical protein
LAHFPLWNIFEAIITIIDKIMNIKLSHLYVVLFIFSIIAINGCKSKKKVTASTEKPPVEEVKEVPPPVVEEKPVEKEPAELTLEAQLEKNFQAIADANSVDYANRNINETLKFFASSDAPVFIVFYRENGEKDYDKPTTIDKHLNYLKDQKKNPYKIDKLIFNDQGKIEEIELTSR